MNCVLSFWRWLFVQLDWKISFQVWRSLRVGHCSTCTCLSALCVCVCLSVCLSVCLYLSLFAHVCVCVSVLSKQDPGLYGFPRILEHESCSPKKQLFFKSCHCVCLEFCTNGLGLCPHPRRLHEWMKHASFFKLPCSLVLLLLCETFWKPDEFWVSCFVHNDRLAFDNSICSRFK